MHFGDVLHIRLSVLSDMLMVEGAFQAFLKKQANLRKLTINPSQKQFIICLGFTQGHE